MRDPYSILGVRRNADQQEIKSAWRAAAKALHPDQNPDDPSAVNRFTEVGRAYDLLRDPEKRRKYDEVSAKAGAGKEKTFMEQRADRARAEAEARAAAELARKAAEMRAAAAAAAVSAQYKDDVDVGARESAEDVVAKIFGTGKAQSKADASRKASETREAPGPETRQERKPETESVATEFVANGDSLQPEGDTKASPALDLIAYVFKRLTRQTPPPERAPDLNIDVQVSIEDILNRINPAATLPEGKLLSITLPPDATEGSKVRIEGYGYRLPGLKRGDVVATLRVKPHKWYRLDGHDILTYLDIDIENAVLGTETEVETPDGPVNVVIPPWSGSQYKARIDGKGLPRGDGTRGDLVAEVRVLLWDHPDQKVIDLMRSMKEGLYL